MCLAVEAYVFRYMEKYSGNSELSLDTHCVGLLIIRTHKYTNALRQQCETPAATTIMIIFILRTSIRCLQESVC